MDAYSGSRRTSMIELFCENSKRLLAVDYFGGNGPSWMFEWAVDSSPRQVYLSVSQGLIFLICLHASPATTFLVLTHCLHYCLASFTMVTVRQGM